MSARSDPVTPALRRRVLARDRHRCVAPTLDVNAGPCRNRWGYPHCFMADDDLTLDHVKDQPMMGKRAPSDEAHLVTLCWGHHLGGWATARRPLLREYLARVSGT